MGQSLSLEYDEVEFSETAARRLGTFIEQLGSSDVDGLRLRVEVETNSAMKYGLSLGDEEIIEDPTEEDTSESTGESTDENTGESTNDDQLPTINPETNKYATGAVIYHADEPITTREISEALEGTEFERDVSPISADLHQMVKSDLVDRHGSPYKHELTERGKKVLERSDEPIEPNPFEESAEDENEDESEEADSESLDQSQEAATAE